jgi:hypothetical protein
MSELIDQLKGESGIFAREWDAQTVVAREGGARTFLHPKDGPLVYEQHTFSPTQRPDYKLVALFPKKAAAF